MTLPAGIAVTGVDPDKHLTQRRITHYAVDPGNILKEIIASVPTATVFFVRETLAA